MDSAATTDSPLGQVLASMPKPLKITLGMMTAYAVLQPLLLSSSSAWVGGVLCALLQILAVYRGSEFFRKLMVVLWRIVSVCTFINIMATVITGIAIGSPDATADIWFVRAASVIYFAYARFNIWCFNRPDVQAWMLLRVAARHGYSEGPLATSAAGN